MSNLNADIFEVPFKFNNLGEGTAQGNNLSLVLSINYGWQMTCLPEHKIPTSGKKSRSSCYWTGFFGFSLFKTIFLSFSKKDDTIEEPIMGVLIYSRLSTLQM